VYSTRVYVYTRPSLTDNLATRGSRVSDKSARILVCVSERNCKRTNGQHRTYTAADRRLTKRVGIKAEQGSRRTRRHLRDDPRAEVGEEVSVGVGDGVRVGAVECQLNATCRRRRRRSTTSVIYSRRLYDVVSLRLHTTNIHRYTCTLCSLRCT